MRIEAFADLRDRSAAFTFRWRAADAAERYGDAGELSWQLIGRGWEVPMKRVRAVVTLPPGRRKRRGARVGPRSAQRRPARRPDGTVALRVDDLAPNTYVEVHVLFPARLLAEAQDHRLDASPSRLAAGGGAGAAGQRAARAGARRGRGASGATTSSRGR